MARMDMVVDSEKGIEESMAAPDAQIPAMAAGGEKELLNPDLHVLPIDGDIVAANTNPGPKKWRLPYWLLVTTSVIVLTNPEFATLTMFLCAICLMLRAMKQMM